MNVYVCVLEKGNEQWIQKEMFQNTENETDERLHFMIQLNS